VWTDDETHFGYIAIECGEMAMRAGTNIEALLRGDPWTMRTVADARGRFELGGLLPRDYRVHALDPQRLLATTMTLAAGARDVALRMPAEDLHPRVAGRVTSLSGDPLEGVEVVLEREAAGIQVTEVQRLESQAATTDADGLFAFEDVSRALSAVSVRGAELGLQVFRRPISAGDDVENLELFVPLRVHVQIVAGEEPDFDEVALLDDSGDKLYLSIQHGQSSYAMREIRLQEGRTEPFSASEAAKTLVLYAQGVEVRRLPLDLVRGQLNTIRP